MKRLLIAGLAVTFAACGGTDVAGPSTQEITLAQEASLIAQDVGTTTGTTHDWWLRRLLDTLRTTDDPEARAFLAQARAYRDSAHQAFQAGDREAARRYLALSFRAILSAVVELFPNAPERTGNAVDQALARIEAHLGDREAPRIRAVLAYVRDLRARADAALAAGEPVDALALNLRAMFILHRLVDHLRDRADHDRIADDGMHRDMEGRTY
jgi:hypothetical protein